ncbi:MAG TPA: FUSC family protein, partial [Variovorax sp.]
MSRPAVPKANGEAQLREAWLMRLAKRSGRALRLSFDAEKRHHGAQLAAAVLLAYLVSALLRLPEHLWAVMSTLIVMRPNTGGTWEAGLNRACGTMIGALGGLAGVWLEHHGVPALATLLAIVAGLSFASAANAALRSAPVAALIILGAGDLPGHSALQVAALRVGQILIGVTVAMGIALASSRHRADA